MSEISHIDATLSSAKEIPAGTVRVLCGDFNSLTLEDYSAAELGAVAEVRRRNRWEAPKDKATTSASNF